MQKLKKDFYTLFAGRTDGFAFTISPPYMGSLDQIEEFHMRTMYALIRWKFICFPEFTPDGDRWHYHGVVRGPLEYIRETLKKLCLVTEVERIKSPEKWFSYITKDLHKMQLVFMSIGYSPKVYLESNQLIDSIVRQNVRVGGLLPFEGDPATPPAPLGGAGNREEAEKNNLINLTDDEKKKIMEALELL